MIFRLIALCPREDVACQTVLEVTERDALGKIILGVLPGSVFKSLGEVTQGGRRYRVEVPFPDRCIAHSPSGVLRALTRIGEGIGGWSRHKDYLKRMTL